MRFDRTRERRESRRVEGRSERVLGRRCRIANQQTKDGMGWDDERIDDGGRGREGRKKGGAREAG